MTLSQPGGNLLQNPTAPRFNHEGGKAIGLKKLQAISSELGFIVPNWEAVGPGELGVMISEYTQTEHNRRASKTLDSNSLGIKSKLEELYERWKGITIMVRSNSEREDGKHTFAGVYESVKINCTSIEVLHNALMVVEKSLNSSLAQQYRRKHRVGDDTMGIIIQEFVEGGSNGYGVIHTAFPNPMYNHGFFISGGPHESVTDGNKGIWSANQYKDSDYTERTVPENIKPYMSQIRKIVVGLEGNYGKSDIEFIIGNDGQIHLVQLRPLNYRDHAPELTGAENIVPLDRWNMANFEGLPVLVVESFENLILQGLKNPLNLPGLDGYWDNIKGLPMSRQAFANALHDFDPNLKYEAANGALESIINFNKAHPEGYVLCIPNGLPRGFGGLPKSLGGQRELLEEALFSNRKAMIVTAFQSTYSNELAHTTVRAREENIPVIRVESGWWDKNEIQLQTGDIVSIRDGHLVRDKKLSDINVDNPKDFYHELHIRDTPEFGKEIIFPGNDEVRLEVFYKFLQTWLDKKTGNSWLLEEHRSRIGASFTQGDRRIDISGFRMYPKYWALAISLEWEKLGLKKDLIENFGICIRNNKYPEDFQEEVYG